MKGQENKTGHQQYTVGKDESSSFSELRFPVTVNILALGDANLVILVCSLCIWAGIVIIFKIGKFSLFPHFLTFRFANRRHCPTVLPASTPGILFPHSGLMRCIKSPRCWAPRSAESTPHFAGPAPMVIGRRYFFARCFDCHISCC